VASAYTKSAPRYEGDEEYDVSTIIREGFN
jgi:hypothetical protein